MVNGDNIFRIDFHDMYVRHKANEALVTIGIVRVSNVKGYGVIVLDGERILDFVEKPDPEEAKSNFVNGGTYMISRKALELLPKEHAFSFEKDFLQKRTAAGGIYGYHFTTFYTVNDMDQYRDVQERLASGRGYGVKSGRP